MTQADDLTAAPTMRHDGWTMDRQLGFLEALADSGSVAKAAAAVGMSASSAYRLRGRLSGDIFAYGWQAAMAMAYYRLREIALERINHGVATPSTWRGEVVATKTVFSDRLLVAMLDHLKPAAASAGPNGVRRPAEDPGRAFAATIEAYHAGIEGGFVPDAPADDTRCAGGCQPRPVMTRAEFIAAIRMRPRLDDVDPAWGEAAAEPSATPGEGEAENSDAGVNFA